MMNATDMLKGGRETRYAPPLKNLPEHLRGDPIHQWRADSGIELIHEEPSLDEFKRILANWALMSEEQKRLSDEKSNELFGVNNMDHAEKLRPIMEKKASDMLKTADEGTTTIGRLIFNDIVPKDIRSMTVGEDGELNSKSIKNILTHVAHKYPDKYLEISHQLLRLGVKGSTETNTSFGLDDLESPVDKGEILKQVNAEIEKINNDTKLTSEERQKKVLKVYDTWGKKMPDLVFAEAMRRGSGLAKMVASGARGNKSQLSSNIGADFAVSDQTGRQIPIPVLRNYSEGLDPAEYFATAYGTRLGLISTKFSVQDGGFFSKLMSAASGDILVEEDDCGTHNGLPVDLKDTSNIGAVLARDTGGVKAGTVITPKVAKAIEGSGHNGKILVRSPITCSTKGGGVCAHCVGIREKGRFPSIGDNVGLSAASGLAEPVTQSLLSMKHSAGVASAGGAAKVTGFPQIEALAQIPKNYPYAATLSTLDGKVDRVEDAPQGGSYITIAGEKHYVPENRGILVKPGMTVEAGDVLSEGTPNPAEVVKYKGVGEGRAYFVTALQKALRENGTAADRRNIEIMSRALVNHIRVGDDDRTGEYLPDDVVEYSAYAEDYKPDKATRTLPIGQAHGMYLQKPALHYTIGTRVTPSVSKTLEEMGEKEVDVSPNKPGFEPEMVRVMDNPSFKPDFMVHTSTSYIKRNLGSDVQSGQAESQTHGKYWQPALAKAVDFGNPPKDKVGY